MPIGMREVFVLLRVLLCVLMVGCLLAAVGCGRPKPARATSAPDAAAAATPAHFEVGGIYSIEDGTGGYRIIKVIATDERFVHVRLYYNRFDTRPIAVEPRKLRLGSMFPPEAGDNRNSMSHMPVRADELITWQPELLDNHPVTAAELEPYEAWLAEGGTGAGTY